jgi:hypothetical protein
LPRIVSNCLRCLPTAWLKLTNSAPALYIITCPFNKLFLNQQGCKITKYMV